MSINEDNTTSEKKTEDKGNFCSVGKKFSTLVLHKATLCLFQFY